MPTNTGFSEKILKGLIICYRTIHRIVRNALKKDSRISIITVRGGSKRIPWEVVA